MLFNSYEFILAFLPATLAGFYLLGARSRSLAFAWLILASLFFYAWWRPLNVLIIAPSLAVNFFAARALAGFAADGNRRTTARLVLALGIVFNLCFLGYFKYVNFFAAVANDLTGSRFVFEQVILPLGISFITFQKIAFLVDVHAGRVKTFSFADYGLFVLFFPQLIAGPIVHYREMMPQFHAATGRVGSADIACGITLFLFGLFKKVVLADGVAGYVSPIYASAADGAAVSLLPAWIAALGFTLQIYFDFSGYSDMALGLARLFGVRLPANFDSPLKATSIIDFWLRWHITLTRFLTAYLYNPLVMWLTRRRLAAGKAALGGRRFDAGAFLLLLAVPTLFTMLVSGLWHGAGYTFLVWGLLHGIYLVVNHGWRQVVVRRLPDKERYARTMAPIGFLLTFGAVLVAMVVFRAPTVAAAGGILEGMVGLNGLSLPPVIGSRLGGLGASLVPWLQSDLDRHVLPAAAWILPQLVIALALPNSLQIMAHMQPAIDFKPRPIAGRAATVMAWQPSAAWALVVSLLVFVIVMQLGGRSEFLYWQF